MSDQSKPEEPITSPSPNEAAPKNSTQVDSSSTTPAPTLNGSEAMDTNVKPAVNLRAHKKIAAPKKESTVAKKTATKSAAKDAKAKPTHPPFFDMITEAIRKLNERAGSSRQAILKFIVSNFKVEEKTGNQHVKVSLKNAVKAGTLKQVKGVGASGSFKLSEMLKSKEKSAENQREQVPKPKSASTPSKQVKKAPAKKAAVVAKKVATSAAKPKKNVAKAKSVSKKPKVNGSKKAAASAAVKKSPAAKKQAVKTVTKQAAKMKTSQPKAKRAAAKKTSKSC
jgi:histone H1/5